MKAVTWIISFSLASVIIISMSLGYIQKGMGQLVCMVLAVILIIQGIRCFKEDIREIKEDFLNKE